MEDKKTIGVTDKHAPVLDVMVASGHFADAIDAAKFAMGVAIRNDAGRGVSDPSVANAPTKWNVGSFDPDGSLNALLSALFPDTDTPYRLLEFLIDIGLGAVETQVAAEGVFDPVEMLPGAAL